MNKNNKAFSLVEFAIVIIIIGVLTALITGSTKLVKQAQIRKVLTEVQMIRNAFSGFEVAYGGLPGDLNDAYDYFGNNCNSNSNICNGDGDGLIELQDESQGGATGGRESDIAFAHLLLAKYITKNLYIAPGGNSTAETFPSKFAEDSCFMTPLSTVDASGNATLANDASAVNGTAAKPSHDNTDLKQAVIILGKNDDSFCQDAIFTAFDARSIDIKLDDAQPYNGSIRVKLGGGTVTTDSNSSNNNCVVGTGTADDDSYNIQGTSIACNLLFTTK